MNADGSGQMELDIEVHPVLRDYLLDLLDSFSDDEQIVLFDNFAIEQAFLEETLIQLDEITSNGYDFLRARFSFRDLGQLLDQSVFNLDQYISLSATQSRKRIEFSLSQNSLVTFLESLPLVNTDSLLYVLPVAGETSRDEYKEDLLWSLEEYESAEVVEVFLEEAKFSLSFYTPGGFTRASEDILLEDNNRKATLELPLLDLLVTETGELFFLEY